MNKSNIAELESESKVKYYRHLGFSIGDNVTIGRGTVFSTDYLEIGNDVTIGEFNDVRGSSIVLGDDIAFGNGNYILCPRGFRLGNCTNWGSDNEVICYSFEAGDYLQAYDSIEVGLGGNMGGMNCLVKMGKGCFIGSRCVLNTSDSIFIGDDVGIGAEVMIWTHGAYLDTTMGFPAKFAPVRIGSHVWLPSRSICLPGVTIGDNVVIGISSLINKDVPGGCFAAGVPARVLREDIYPKQLTRLELETLAVQIIRRYQPLAEFKGLDVVLSYVRDIECITLLDKTVGAPKGITDFYLREKQATSAAGPMSNTAEDFRDFLRRNGIKIFTRKRFRSVAPLAYEKWIEEESNEQ